MDDGFVRALEKETVERHQMRVISHCWSLNIEMWKSADPDRPELQAARRFVQSAAREPHISGLPLEYASAPIYEGGGLWRRALVCRQITDPIGDLPRNVPREVREVSNLHFTIVVCDRQPIGIANERDTLCAVGPFCHSCEPQAVCRIPQANCPVAAR
jgi:hypothetical protein